MNKCQNMNKDKTKSKNASGIFLLQECENAAYNTVQVNL